MLVFIKYFTIVFCSFYIYGKLLNLPRPQNHYVYLLIGIPCLSLGAFLSDTLFPQATDLVLILMSFFFLLRIAKTLPEASVNATIISYGITYIVFSLSALISSSILVFIFHMTSDSYSHLLSQVLTAFIQIAITPILFRPQRYRKGMPFITNRLSSFPLMVFSLIILFAVVIFKAGNSSLINLFPFLLIFLMAIFIYITWKNNITKTYIERLKEKDIAELNSTLSEKEQYIKKLEEENKELSTIIHSDNKLIPAMLLSVKEFIKDSSSLVPASSKTGARLLSDLEQLSLHRKDILRTQDERCRSIPETGCSSVDSILKYMKQKAYEMNIHFDIAFSCNMKALVDENISENDLNTLLADLLENAMIATKYGDCRHVLLTVDMIEDFYSINVFDSGIPFSKEVLVNLGIKNYTTHKTEGGSGIGLVTSYELLKKYNASLAIEEFIQDSGLYTKKLSIVFNRLSQYTLFTYRNRDELDFLNSRTDLLIVHKTMPVMG